MKKVIILMIVMNIVFSVFAFAALGLSVPSVQFTSIEDFETYLKTGSTNKDDYIDPPSDMKHMPKLEEYMEYYISPFEIFEIDTSTLNDVKIAYVACYSDKTCYLFDEITVEISKIRTDMTPSEYIYDDLRENNIPEEDIEFDSRGRVIGYGGVLRYSYREVDGFEVVYDRVPMNNYERASKICILIGGYLFFITDPDNVDPDYFNNYQERVDYFEKMKHISALFSSDQEVFENGFRRIANAVSEKLGTEASPPETTVPPETPPPETSGVATSPNSGEDSSEITNTPETNDVTDLKGDNTDDNSKPSGGCGGFSLLPAFIALICAAGAATVIRKK